MPSAIGTKSSANSGSVPITFSARRRTTVLHDAFAMKWISTKNRAPIAMLRKNTNETSQENTNCFGSPARSSSDPPIPSAPTTPP